MHPINYSPCVGGYSCRNNIKVLIEFQTQRIWWKRKSTLSKKETGEPMSLSQIEIIRRLRKLFQDNPRGNGKIRSKFVKRLNWVNHDDELKEMKKKKEDLTDKRLKLLTMNDGRDERTRE